MPALRALAHANLEADQLLLCLPASRRSAPACIRRGPPCGPAGRRRPPTRTRTGAQTDRASASVRTRPATPPSVWRSPPGRNSAHPHTARGQRLLEVARRDAPQVETRQKCVQAPRAPCPQRQDRRREANPLAIAGRRAIPKIFTRATSTAPIPVWIVRTGPWPCRTGGRGHRKLHALSSRREMPRLPSRQPAQAAPAHQIARYSSVDRRSRRADAVGQGCYSHSWRIALLERFWQARHPPRYAAYLIPSSPSFPHSSLVRRNQDCVYALIPQPSLERSVPREKHRGALLTRRTLSDGVIN